jgi:hypothetical protein
LEEDTRIWKDLSCSRIGRINIAKTTLLPKAIYKFNPISIKIPMSLFIEILKINLEIYKEAQNFS